jgi:hypothetical protein
MDEAGNLSGGKELARQGLELPNGDHGPVHGEVVIYIKGHEMLLSFIVVAEGSTDFFVRKGSRIRGFKG